MNIPEHKSVTEDIIYYIKNNIINGTWNPGDKISSENELSMQLSVSRSSVRYAIQQLIAIGVLESFQGKGTFVKTKPIGDIERKLELLYDNADIEQLVEFRIIIEGEGCKLAAKRMTEQSLNRLKVILVNMMNSLSNREDFIKEDIAFHQEILRTTGNQLIVRSMRYVMNEIEFQQHAFNTEDKMKNAIEWHRSILVELERGNGEAAARYMIEHLKGSAEA